MPLTDLAIKSFDVPPKGSKTYFDDTLKGFGVRVSMGGTRTFILIKGKERQRTRIGSYPHVSLSKARDIAKTLLAERQLGRHQPKRTTLEAALALYIEQHLSKLAPRTQTEQRRIFKRYLGKLTARPVHEIVTADITKLTDKAAPSEAEHLHRVMKTVFRWCVGRRMIDRSPLEGLSPPPQGKPRDRILTDEELIKVWTAAGECGQFGTITKLLLLTGCRRSEIGGLRSEWVNLEQKTICLPAAVTKNSREHTFPIGQLACELLRSATSSNAHVLFPARGSDVKPFNGWSKSKAALDKQLSEIIGQLERWTLHDLRRTFASGLQRLGVRMEVTERYLNHVSGSFSGITGIYQKYSYQDEMRAAAELWESHIASLLQKAHDSAALGA